MYISQDGDDGDSEAVAHTARRYALQHDMVHLQVAPSAWSSSPQRIARALPVGLTGPVPLRRSAPRERRGLPQHPRMAQRVPKISNVVYIAAHYKWAMEQVGPSRAGPVPVQMWQRRARSRCRCGQG